MAEPLLSVRLRQPLRDLDEIPENDEDHHPSMDESSLLFLFLFIIIMIIVLNKFYFVLKKVEEDSKYKNFFQVKF